MRLQDARLCADCDEVHDLQQCPHCASERFGYLSRWVPIPKERVRPRPKTSPTAEVFKQLIEEPGPLQTQSGVRRFLKQGAVGLTAVGVVGWLWRSSERARHDQAKPAPGADAQRSGGE
jgi:hypothetical protein